MYNIVKKIWERNVDEIIEMCALLMIEKIVRVLELEDLHLNPKSIGFD